MGSYVIIPDVTCDLSEEVREKFGITDYMHGYTHINGVSVKTVLDWSEISREEFYKTLESKKNTVSSATASPEEFYEKFKYYAERGIDVLSMSISSKISGTYNIAAAAAKRVSEEFPERKILALDSYRMSGSFGLLVINAALKRDEGLSIDELYAWLEENKHCVHQMGPIDDMTFIARRGKISAGKAFMGNLVGIKPMGDSNTEGYVTVLAKVKGIQKALAATVNYIAEMGRDIENQYILISHSVREEHAQTLKRLIEERFSTKGVFVVDVFSASGTNIGPGMIGVYFMGDPVSENCEKEKEALNLAISNL